MAALPTRSPLTSLPAQLELEPIYTILNSMALLNLPDGRTDLHPWVAQAAAELSPESRHVNRLVFAALRDALVPDRAWPTFPAYLEHLSTQNPFALRDRLLQRLAPLAPAELLADPQVYAAHVAALHPDAAGEPALLAEAHGLINDPPAMHDLIVAHLDRMWEMVLAGEWSSASRALQRQLQVFQQCLEPEASAAETVRALTGRQVSGAIQVPAAEVERIILIPSPHNGWAVTTWYSDRTLRLFFGAPLNFGVLLRSSPVGAAELRIRLAALADDTRLRVLELLARHYELHAQELIGQLNLSQSSVSRHLKQLIAAGYLVERRGEGANKIYSLSAIELGRTTRALELLAAGAPLSAPEQHEEERVQHPQEIERFLDPRGRLRLWPSKQRDKILLLPYLALRFELGRFYTEKEVNEILRAHILFEDYVSLRRALFEYRLMKREPDGSRYWRAELPEPIGDIPVIF